MRVISERINSLEELRISATLELNSGLVKALKDKSPTVRGLAVEIIGEEKLNEMLEEILPMLEDSNSEVRMLAIESIGSLVGNKAYIKEIADLLNDKNELVRVSAAEFLGEFGNVTVIDKLEMGLNDKSALVRTYVAESIGSIGHQKSITILEKYLLSENDEGAKVGFYVGLYKLNKKEALGKLIELLGSENYRVRCAVANSLSSLNLSSTEISQVLKKLQDALVEEKTVAARSSIESTLEFFST